jgi:NADPH-dependent curcumin reductase
MLIMKSDTADKGGLVVICLSFRSYKDVAGVDAGLKRALAGRKVDVYFDNVGGETLEAVLRRVNIGARIVLCGAISRYNDSNGNSSSGEAPTAVGPRNYTQLITRRACMRGFIVLDYADRYAAAQREIAKWLGEGCITARETRIRGIEQAPQALLGLFQGKNVGKVVVEVASLRCAEEYASVPNVGRCKL